MLLPVAEIVSRTDNWTAWLNSWIRDIDKETLIAFQLSNIGIYVDRLTIVFDVNI